MIHIIISIILVVICFSKGYWRRWKEYYPTILFFIVGDLTYNFIMYNYSLWEYGMPLWPGLGHSYIDLYWAVIIFPCIVILFLTLCPEKRSKLPVYIVLWAAGFALVEYVMYLTDSMHYQNGWRTFYSFLFDLVMFPILFIHYKKPQFAWLITTAIVPLFILIVQMPLDRIK